MASKKAQLLDEFYDLINSDPDFNYKEGEFEEWLFDNNLTFDD